MKNIIIYVGGFRLPEGNASAQRVVVNARLFESLGYKVVLVGKNQLTGDEISDSTVTSFMVDGMDCYDIRHPDKERIYPSYVSNIDSIKQIISKYGMENIFAIMPYNYPAAGLRQIINFSRKNGINVIPDTTEWYGAETSHFIKSIIRFAQTEYRMRILHKRVRNLICGSRYLQRFYSNAHTVVLPNCVDMSKPKWSMPISDPHAHARKFIYAGSPGSGMSKEYVHWMVDAFAELKQAEHEFSFTIVGITEEQLLKVFPDYANKIKSLGESITFMGRLQHLDTIKQMRQSDIFVFIRPDNRVCKAGCPTKLAEAFACGLPVITNDTGDISVYMNNPNHGFLFPHPDREELKDAIVRALGVTDDELKSMKKYCLENNLFRYEVYQEPVKEFFLTLK